MPKYVAPDRGVGSVEIEGARTGAKRVLRAGKDGLFSADSTADKKALEGSGFVQASLMGTTNKELGFLCPKCGFGSWFKICGRCSFDIENGEYIEDEETETDDSSRSD